MDEANTEKTVCQPSKSRIISPVDENSPDCDAVGIIAPTENEVYTVKEKDVLSRKPSGQGKSLFREDLVGFGFSQQGQSHVEDDIPCQDYSDFCILEAWPIAICAISDGVGSCEMSHYGSKTAVRAAIKTVISELSRLLQSSEFVFANNQLMKQILVKAFEAAVKEVEEQAHDMQKAPSLFQSTLTVAIYDGKDLYFGHAGDDGIVVLCKDGTCQMVTSRHKGEEASSVITLQAHMWQFGRIDRDVSCFVAMTDGVLDAVVGTQLYDNRIYYPFFDKIFNSDYSSLNSVSDTCKIMFDALLSSGYRERVYDDITLVAVANPGLLENTQKPIFDKVAWERKDKEVAKLVDSILYSSDKHVDSDMQEQKTRPLTKQDMQTPAYSSECESNSAIPQSISNKPSSLPAVKIGSEKPVFRQVCYSIQPGDNDVYPLLPPNSISYYYRGKNCEKKERTRTTGILSSDAAFVGNQVGQEIYRYIIDCLSYED